MTCLNFLVLDLILVLLSTTLALTLPQQQNVCLEMINWLKSQEALSDKQVYIDSDPSCII